MSEVPLWGARKQKVAYDEIPLYMWAAMQRRPRPQQTCRSRATTEPFGTQLVRHVRDPEMISAISRCKSIVVLLFVFAKRSRSLVFEGNAVHGISRGVGVDIHVLEHCVLDA